MPRGSRRGGRPAAGGTTADRTAACRRSSAHPSRGPAPAAPSRPDRRACARAAPARRRAPRRAPGSGPRGQQLRVHPRCPPLRKAPARQRIPMTEPVRARSRPPWRSRVADGGRRSARWSASPRPRRRSAPTNPAHRTARRTSVRRRLRARWRIPRRPPRSAATGLGRSIAVAHRFPRAAAGFRVRTRWC